MPLNIGPVTLTLDQLLTVVTLAISGVIGVLLHLSGKNRESAQAVADYAEATEAQIREHAEVAVRAAELFGITAARPGVDKALFALDFLEDSLARNGIKGDASRVNRERLQADVEAAWKRLFEKPKAA